MTTKKFQDFWKMLCCYVRLNISYKGADRLDVTSFHMTYRGVFCGFQRG